MPSVRNLSAPMGAQSVAGRSVEADAAASLTIVVPTCNRYPYLLRLLKYYQACGAPMRMHILDSSRHAQPGQAIERLITTLAISYTRYDAGLEPIPMIHDGVKRVTTPYVVLWADDDFLVPKAVAAAAQFLDAHRDFRVAHGVGGIFTIRPSTHGPAELDIGPYLQCSVLDATASSRLVTYLTTRYSIFYSVYRTPELQQNLDQSVAHGFGHFWEELARSWLFAIQGKAKKLDGLYIMRQMSHDSQGDGWYPKRGSHAFSWVTMPSFPGHCDRFLECVARALAQQDGMSFSRAREFAEELFWGYLARVLAMDWTRRYEQPSQRLWARLRAAVRNVPMARNAWRAARSVLPGGNHELSLASLRRPSSPYHDSFAPIYQAITEEEPAMIADEAAAPLHRPDQTPCARE
ncbi:MAG TPA: hypothetical protein DDX89_01605 [Candidatus Omnitrophica bacterium]|nr:hypothetical protein [Candidatus Omnitrophota bacterium]